MKIISSTILVLLAINCLNARSKNDINDVPQNPESFQQSHSETIIQTAIVDTIIDPITIQVLQTNQKTVVKLIGLATPDLAGNSKIYDSALNFTKFHLHKGKEVRIQKDRYNKNEEFQWRYLFVDGEMYNKLMLTNGYAIVSGPHGQFEHKEEFQAIEQKAQDSNLGYWENTKDRINIQQNRVKTLNTNEPTGTLPKINLTKAADQTCDYTQDNIPVIKGNYDKNMETKIYYLPDSIFYKTIEISPNEGDRWFCIESEAKRNGWVKSKH